MTVNFETLKELGLTQTQPPRQSSNELGQAQFLKLMTMQLMNQDPMKPMESGDFLGQIAQFSTVSGIQDLQRSFAEFSSALSSDQALQAANLVGRSVFVPMDQAVLSAGGVLEGEVTLPANASSVVVNILDRNGQLVRSIDMGPQGGGQVPFTWDGLSADGNFADPGIYRVQSQAVVYGQNVGLPTQMKATVESVTLGGVSGGLKLNLAGLGPVSFKHVTQIL